MPLIHFILVYNLGLGRLVETHEFKDSAAAVAKYGELERKHAGEGQFEIVLVGADSIDTIRRTHGQYFNGARDPAASPYLAGV